MLETYRSKEHSDIEICLSEKRYEEAKALLHRRLGQNPSDEDNRLYLLLVNATVHGPAKYEKEIDKLRHLPDLAGTRKEIVRRLFLLVYDYALEAGDEKKAWVYQRLLRRLLLDQSLDLQIGESTAAAPRPGVGERKVAAAKSVPAPRTVHFHRLNSLKRLTTTARLKGALGSLVFVIFCFWWMLGGDTDAAAYKAAYSSLPASASTVASLPHRAGADGIQTAAAFTIPWNFVLFFVAVVFWSMSLFLVSETARSQKGTLAETGGLPEPLAGVEMAHWISFLIVFLWFARALFSQAGQDPFKFLFDLLRDPEQLTPGILLAVFPPVFVGTVKLVLALGIKRGEVEDQPTRENRLWISAVLLALNVLFAAAAAILLSRFIL